MNKKTQSKFLFKVLWSKTYVGIAITEIQNGVFEIPLTTFYFWPREDGWKLLKDDLDSKPWMDKQVKVEIMNGYTTIINYWLNNVSNTQTATKQNIEKLDINVEVLGINLINT